MTSLAPSLACTLHGALDLRLEPCAAAEPGPHEVELQLGAGGICGSDLHYYREGRAGAFAIREPFVPGHEASGVVARVGSAVSRVRPGQKVAIDPSHPCGRCEDCRAGRANLCRDMRFLGSAARFPHAQGMFRERFVMDERQLTPVDEPEVSLGEIACAEPLSVGLHAVRRAGELLGQRVLVTGAGTIGCMCVIAARLAGAAEVVALDPGERAQALAREVGADRALAAGDALPDALRGWADVAIEAAGSPAALAACLAAVRRGGRVVQVGTLPASVPFPANEVMVRELDYIGAFRANGEFDAAVRFIRTRRADVRPLITAQIPISRAREAFELALDRTRSTKVQLVAG
ncbi:L-idonate 5-dehydrogenase [Caldimonas tepidiphila]|uniref:L-idonate 5-dehydrogenase n=1 Tax=Caldimonas tepidiphila TaxID=2315841 RepID=UPI000E5AA8EA|nr:L-idonate 5-dehydrogenase [Caldimonas tepidiphila]